jgi:hypothetical protein
MVCPGILIAIAAPAIAGLVGRSKNQERAHGAVHVAAATTSAAEFNPAPRTFERGKRSRSTLYGPMPGFQLLPDFGS